ncbi:hypothetical protein K435DRAFT_27203 [Dendrothele bispora CBS 962.96]|uniref:F-box domain-containing protein n=1 Tax=Dendrothele bispora (strain CBS 962.96) TaxID=1314807 RepID=A0A4V4HGE9_DENBC|nr:hypothetical protein K435DRAFT_27203 [Dendrothele bispora CBS 962.96]
MSSIDQLNMKITATLTLSGEALPEKLWTMLLDHCPDLETLVIGHRGAMYFSRRHINVSPITRAKWPRLRELTMENCWIYGILDSLEAIECSRALFTSFVRSHPKLTHLHLKGLPCLDVDFRDPPFALQSYGSGIESNPYIAITTGSVREMNFTQKEYSGVFFKYIRLVLLVNPNVRKLTLAMNFSRDNTVEADRNVYDHIDELKDVVACCNRLEDLTVICSTKRKETFLYKDFPEVLRGSSIKRVELWKYHRAGDEPPANLALRIARENPSMERIVIRTLHHQLWDKEYDPLRILQIGYYKVVRDIEGRPLRLAVNEMGGETMAWMLTSKFTLPIAPPKWRSLLKERLVPLLRVKERKSAASDV